MPRMSRKKSETGIYHVMLRGINKQIIFNDEEDHKKFLYIVKDCKLISGFKLLAYCLMGNHVHLFIKEEKEQLEQIFKRVGTRYVSWFNNKYGRTGHLFQDRFKSEPVENEGYFLTVLRYIHQNPVKAGLCKDASEYRWSSYNDYLRNTGITDTEFALSMFSEDRKEACLLFEKFMKEEEEVRCLDVDNNRRLTDEEAQELIMRLCGIEDIAKFQGMTKEKRDKTIALLKENGLSIRQISRLTGISFSVVRKR